MTKLSNSAIIIAETFQNGDIIRLESCDVTHAAPLWIKKEEQRLQKGQFKRIFTEANFWKRETHSQIVSNFKIITLENNLKNKPNSLLNSINSDRGKVSNDGMGGVRSP